MSRNHLETGLPATATLRAAIAAGPVAAAIPYLEYDYRFLWELALNNPNEIVSFRSGDREVIGENLRILIAGSLALPLIAIVLAFVIWPRTHPRR